MNLADAPSTEIAVLLVEAWARVARVNGPQLGDLRAPLVQRVATFMARVRAFKPERR